MTEVGHKDETVRDQGLFILFYVDVALSSLFFLCSVVAFFYYDVLYCNLLFLVYLILKYQLHVTFKKFNYLVAFNYSPYIY